MDKEALIILIGHFKYIDNSEVTEKVRRFMIWFRKQPKSYKEKYNNTYDNKMKIINDFDNYDYDNYIMR
jgi:hypothetical protein